MTEAGERTALSSWAARQLEQGKHVYAVADAARNRDMAFDARDRYGLNIRWLFSDNVSNNMAEVAPYLVDIAFSPEQNGHGYLKQWSAHQGRSIGILLLTTADAGLTWRHLRQVFVVTDEARRSYYFRFYDPRVLRTFLPACSGAEAREFFGPVEQILVEAESASRLLGCRWNGDGVTMDEWQPFVRAGRAVGKRNRR